MTLGQKQRIFLKNVFKLVEFAHALGFDITFGEAERPQIVQDMYLNSEPPKTTVKTSQHQKRLAIDFNFFLSGEYVNGKEDAKKILQDVGDYWESLDPDNRWGGNWETFVDTPHFEMRG